MLPAFYLSCNEMISKWEKRMSSEGISEFDVQPDLQALSSDVISRAAFGSSYEEGKRIFELQSKLGDLVIEASQSLYVPGSRFLPTKKNKMMKALSKEVDSSIKKIINRRLMAMKEGETCNQDLLGILLESNCKEIEQNGNEKFGMSIEEVSEECRLFYLAGQETTSTLLSWTMVLLALHPHWQAHAREEVLQFFQNKEPDFDGLNRLKIVNMILNEALRLYPPAPVIRREIHEETKLGEMTLLAGILIAVPAMMIHHDHELWGEDVKEFKPERFSEGVSKVTKNKVSYFPFSRGPRICIGQSFALLEAKLVVSMILQRFSFTISPLYTHAPATIISLHPQHGVHLTVQHYNKFEAIATRYRYGI